MLQVPVGAENSAVRRWVRISVILNRLIRSAHNDCCVSLNEEIGHEALCSEFPEEGEGGQLLRLGDTSPFAPKFLR
jgi:ferritin-like protein